MITATFLLGMLGCLACTKDNSNTPPNLVLLQHKWEVVSIHGEALLYTGKPGDYFNFVPNGTLYRFINGISDTAQYALDLSGKSLYLTPILNGVKSGTTTTYAVNTLANNQLVFSRSGGVGFFSVDSLKR